MLNNNLNSKNILWIKEVGTPESWAYMDYNESDTFYLHWPDTAPGHVKKAGIGDIILLKQHKKLTHLVVPYSDIIGFANSKKYPYYREVICLKKINEPDAPYANEVFPFSLKGSPHGNGCLLEGFVNRNSNVITFNELQKRIWTVFFPDQNETEITLPVIDEAEPSELKRPEGEEFYDYYRRRKRSAELAKLVKQKAKTKYGKLICEACGFSFEDKYGTYGENYIEAHHLVPISSYKIETETSEKDIKLLCSNCHRMIHSRNPMLTLAELKNIIVR